MLPRDRSLDCPQVGTRTLSLGSQSRHAKYKGSRALVESELTRPTYPVWAPPSYESAIPTTSPFLTLPRNCAAGKQVSFLESGNGTSSPQKQKGISSTNIQVCSHGALTRNIVREEEKASGLLSFFIQVR